MKGVERPRNVHYRAVILTLSLPKGKAPGRSRCAKRKITAASGALVRQLRCRTLRAGVFRIRSR
jgi:hypothetical protein